jgi:hypothetical protein
MLELFPTCSDGKELICDRLIQKLLEITKFEHELLCLLVAFTSVVAFLPHQLK